MRINHNLAALNTYSRLTTANFNQGKSLEKLSSGLRINRAGDDEAGRAIAEKMRQQMRGLGSYTSAEQDPLNKILNAEDGLNQIDGKVREIRSLAIQGSNGLTTSVERAGLQDEYKRLSTEIDELARTNIFDPERLVNGNGGSETSGETSVNATSNFSTEGLGIADLDFSTEESSAAALEKLKSAEEMLSGQGKTLQNARSNQMTNMTQSLRTNAEERIKDVDMAKEMMEFTQKNILNQAATAMLAQANQAPQGVLQLLR